MGALLPFFLSGRQPQVPGTIVPRAPLGMNPETYMALQAQMNQQAMQRYAAERDNSALQNQQQQQALNMAMSFDQIRRQEQQRQLENRLAQRKMTVYEKQQNRLFDEYSRPRTQVYQSVVAGPDGLPRKQFQQVMTDPVTGQMTMGPTLDGGAIYQEPKRSASGGVGGTSRAQMKWVTNYPYSPEPAPNAPGPQMPIPYTGNLDVSTGKFVPMYPTPQKESRTEKEEPKSTKPDKEMIDIAEKLVSMSIEDPDRAKAMANVYRSMGIMPKGIEQLFVNPIDDGEDTKKYLERAKVGDFVSVKGKVFKKTSEGLELIE